MYDIIISVDPGFSGGIAKFSNNKLDEYFKMPTKKMSKNKKKVELDIKSLAEYFFKQKYNNVIIVIENIHALPYMNIQSMFRFGEQLGIFKALAVANNFDYNLISIKAWKNYFKLDKDKLKSVDLANSLFNLNLKKSEDGIAEAILIGKYYIDNSIKT